MMISLDCKELASITLHLAIIKLAIMQQVSKLIFLMALISCFACGDGQSSKAPEEKVVAKPSPQDQADQIAERQLSEKEKQAFMDGEIDYKVIAQDFCECSQEAIKVYTEADRLIKENIKDREAVKTYSNQQTEVIEAAVKCCIEVKSKRTSAKLDKKPLTENLKTECPDLNMPITIQILIKAIY